VCVIGTTPFERIHTFLVCRTFAVCVCSHICVCVAWQGAQSLEALLKENKINFEALKRENGGVWPMRLDDVALKELCACVDMKPKKLSKLIENMRKTESG